MQTIPGGAAQGGALDAVATGADDAEGSAEGSTAGEGSGVGADVTAGDTDSGSWAGCPPHAATTTSTPTTLVPRIATTLAWRARADHTIALALRRDLRHYPNLRATSRAQPHRSAPSAGPRGAKEGTPSRPRTPFSCLVAPARGESLGSSHWAVDEGIRE